MSNNGSGSTFPYSHTVNREYCSDEAGRAKADKIAGNKWAREDLGNGESRYCFDTRFRRDQFIAEVDRLIRRARLRVISGDKG
jgi:hypothetical protein